MNRPGSSPSRKPASPPFPPSSSEGATHDLKPWDSPNHLMAPWFGTARRRRAEHYAQRTPRRHPPTRALVTIVHNESVFLPIWLRYYSRFFAAQDIYVLDHQSTDGCTAQGAFQRIAVTHDSVDHTWMVQRIEALQHELLKSYELVVVTDVDEIIAPAPALGTLGDYLDRFDEEWVNCLGYELLHLPDREPRLDLNRPILDQRQFWYFNGAYDKAAVATVPMTWRPGFHGRADFQFNPDPDLRLIHLHRMDYGICLQRHRVRGQLPWAPLDAEKRWAVHNQIVDEAQFHQWFTRDSGFEGFAGFSMQVEQIGALWQGLF